MCKYMYILCLRPRWQRGATYVTHLATSSLAYARFASVPHDFDAHVASLPALLQSSKTAISLTGERLSSCSMVQKHQQSEKRYEL